jgi:hypothetical protein
MLPKPTEVMIVKVVLRELRISAQTDAILKLIGMLEEADDTRPPKVKPLSESEERKVMEES